MTDQNRKDYTGSNICLSKPTPLPTHPTEGIIKILMVVMIVITSTC
jgi:hypothetical protein